MSIRRALDIVEPSAREAGRLSRSAARLADGGIHALMIGSLVVMVGTRDAAASVGAGLALIVVAMSMAVAARRSHRAFIHVLDLLAMGTATIVGCMSGSDDVHASGGMAGMPGHSAGMALPFAIAIVVAWGVVRIALACAWRRPAFWMAATGALTGGCLCVMFVV